MRRAFVFLVLLLLAALALADERVYDGWDGTTHVESDQEYLYDGWGGSTHLETLEAATPATGRVMVVN